MKKRRKKLTLKRETVRSMELGQVAGGWSDHTFCTACQTQIPERCPDSGVCSDGDCITDYGCTTGIYCW